MRRLVAGAGLTVATLVGLLVPSAAASSTPVPSAQASVSDSGSSALADLSSCAAQADTLLAVIVVDQSGSLRQTDPEALRVGAIETAIESLASLDDQDDIVVEASLATFGTAYEELVAWGPVTGAHGDKLLGSVRNELPYRNQDNLTDYRAALRGAQDSLEARSEAVGGDNCSLVLWFTDGKLDADGTDATGPLTEQAVRDLCSVQGIADDLRANHITVLALALFTEGAINSPTQADRALLRAIAEGSNPEQECGTSPVPEDWNQGAYLRAENADTLRAVFAQAGALLEGGVLDATNACPGPACVGGILTIPADQGIQRFRVVTDRSIGSNTVSLVAPDGSSLALEDGASQLAGADVVVSDSDGLSTIEVRFAGGQSSGGEWQLDLSGTADARASVYYFWGARAQLDVPPSGLIVGETTEIPIVVTLGGMPIDPAVYGSLDVTATANGAEVTVKNGPSGPVASVTVPSNDVAPEVELSVAIRATTTPSGHVLGPISAHLDAATQLPPSYPTVSPAEIKFPEIVGTEPVSTTVTVTGSERGATRACLRAGTSVAPDGAGAVTVTPEVECVDLAANETREITVLLTTESGADGRIDAELVAELFGVDGASPVNVTVPASASMVRPVNETMRWGVVAVLLLLAGLIAFVTAWLTRHLSDRFILGSRAQYCAVGIEVAQGAVTRTPGHAGFALDPAQDFTRMGEIGAKESVAKFSAGALAFYRTMPPNPFSAAHAWVSADGDLIAFGRYGAVSPRDPGVAPVPFPGTTEFVVTANPADVNEDGFRGRLTMVVDAPEGVAQVIEDRTAEVRGADWTVIHQALLAASSSGTASLPEASSSPRRKQRKGDHDGTNPQPPASQGSLITDAPARPAFGLDQGGAQPEVAPPPSSDLLGGSPAPMAALPQSRRSRTKRSKEPGPTTEPLAPAPDATSGPPAPPRTNFFGDD